MDNNDFLQQGEDIRMVAHTRGLVMGIAAGAFWGLLTYPIAFMAVITNDYAYPHAVLLGWVVFALIITQVVQLSSESESKSDLLRFRGLREVFLRHYWKAYWGMLAVGVASVYLAWTTLFDLAEPESKNDAWKIGYFILWSILVIGAIYGMYAGKGRNYKLE